MTTVAPTPSAPVRFAVTPAASPVPGEERDAVLANPGFGRVHTDHMVTVRWTRERGWHDAEIGEYRPLQLDPATAALHYGQSIFEGFKAYGQPDGRVKTFRPYDNAQRFARSARRLALPVLPDELFVAASDKLISIDRDWVPQEVEKSLYLRPFMFASEVLIGVRPADEVLFLLIAFPSGAYFPQGIKPVTIWLSEDYSRAAPGGTGAAKCAGNYAASLIAQQEAIDEGCDQVVFLDAVERRWVEELGGMNLFFVFDDGSMVTPELTGTILEGITRESLIVLAGEQGMKVEERRISIDEWRDGAASGRITEVFACGTAAVITPLASLRWRGGEVSIGDGHAGPVATSLRAALLDIQHGLAPDHHGWMHLVS